nr:ankyrin repeat-containing protein At5g02620-like [Ziziphus jujuba var. spinosa]
MDPKLYDAAINGSHDLSAIRDAADTANLSGQKTTELKNTILHVAAKSGKLQIADDQPHVVGLLYEKNKKGNTALHIAAKFGHLDFVRVLIKARKADVERNTKLLTMVNEQGETALHEAVRHDHFDIVKLLIEEQPDLVSLTNHAGESPLFMAVDRCFYPVALHILGKNNSSFDGRNGMNVLHAAAIRSQSCRRNSTFKEDLSLFFRNLHRIHKLHRQPLLSRLPKPKSDDDFGWTPLHYAAHYGNTELVKQFLQQGDNINTSLACKKNKQGMSSLHIAAKKGHIDVIRTLIKACPEICELFDNKNRTALHVAVESREAEVVKFFLQSLTFLDLINEKDNKGNTALHLAAASSIADFKILGMLANDSKIDKEATNNDGMTFYDIVLSNKQLKDKEILEVVLLNFEGGTGLPSLEQKFIREETKEAEINKVNHEAEKDGQVDGEGKEQPNGEDVQKKHVASDKKKHSPQLKQAVKDFATINLMIATFIATATFTAAFQLPGGYNNDGLAVSSSRADFKKFLFCDTVAFVCSTASMLIHFIVPVLGALAVPLYPMSWITLLTGTSLVFMVIAFDQGIRAIFPEHSARNPFPILPMVVLIFMAVMGTSIIIF